MKLIIDIPEEDYRECKFRKDLLSLGEEPTDLTFNMRMETLIANGTLLPEGHGRLIDKDHMIARLEAASKFYGGENADAFDERFSHGLKEAAIKVAEEPTIIEADKGV